MTLSQKICLVIILLAACAVRLYKLDSDGMWNDEKVTVSIARGIHCFERSDSVFTVSQVRLQNTLANVYRATVQDNGNSIIYNVSLHYWFILFGNSDAAARSFSALWSLALVIAVFYMVRKPGGINLALLVMALFAMHPLLVKYAHCSRAFTMGTFFALAASATWFSLMQQQAIVPGKKAITYVCFAAGMLLCHYYAVYVLMAHGLSALLMGNFARKWKSYILILAGVLVIFTGWMLLGGLAGLQVMKSQIGFYKATISAGTATEVLRVLSIRGFFIALMQNTLAIFGINLHGLDVRLIIKLIFLLAVTGILFNGYHHSKNMLLKKLMLFGFMHLLAYWMLMAVLGCTSRNYLPFIDKYASFGTPLVLVMLAVALYEGAQTAGGHIKRIIAATPAMFFILLSAASTVLYVFGKNSWKGRREKSPYPQLAAVADKNYQPGDTLIFAHMPDAVLASIYCKNSNMVIKAAGSQQGLVVILKKQNGTLLPVYDLNGKKY